MTRNRRWRLCGTRFHFTLATCATALAGETRTWSDKSGKFSITAELIAVQQGHVVLRTGRRPATHRAGQEPQHATIRISSKD